MQWLLASDGHSGPGGGHEPCSLDPKSGEDGAGDALDVAHAVDSMKHASTLVMLGNGPRLCVIGGQSSPNRIFGIVGPAALDETAARAP